MPNIGGPYRILGSGLVGRLSWSSQEAFLVQVGCGCGIGTIFDQELRSRPELEACAQSRACFVDVSYLERTDAGNRQHPDVQRIHVLTQQISDLKCEKADGVRASCAVAQRYRSGGLTSCPS